MSMLENVKFEFTSEALPADTFAVIDFAGEEGLSQCYSFEVNLVSEKADPDLDAVLKTPATLTIKDDDQGDLRFNGIVTHIDLTHKFNEYTFYRAVLTPRLKWMDMIHHNQVFLDQSIEGMLQQLLKDAGLLSTDFEFRLRNQEFDPPRELLCQYRQNHLAFFSFWAEHMGMYYFFEQSNAQEKLIVTNDKLAHSRLSDDKQKLFYSPPSGLDADRRTQVLTSFVSRRQRLPRKVLVRDYDYDHPSLDLTAEAEVSTDGLGHVYLYADHYQFRDEKQGKYLAGLRAEELNCRKQVFMGKSQSTLIRSGYIFEVAEHFQSDLNREYLTVKSIHRGNQFMYLVAGLRQVLADREESPLYENEFTAIPADVQFRSERKTQGSKIWGAMTASVDAAGSGRFAELDNEGRYKVILPFDLSGRSGLKASAWLRMAQPYTGSNHGMHFPLHKGAEVLLAFIAGDPSRPVIIGSVPNAANRSVVNAESAHLSGIRMPTGSSMVFNDLRGGSSVMLNASVSDEPSTDDSSSDEPAPPPKDVSNDALISLSRDHGLAEAVTQAGTVNAVAGTVSNEVVGLAKNLHSLGSDSKLVGAPIFKAISTLVNNTIQKLPSLVVTAAKDGLDIGKSEYTKTKEDEQKAKNEEISAHYDAEKKKVDQDASLTPEQKWIKKKDLDEQAQKKKDEWGRYYSEQKKKGSEAFTHSKTGLSFLSTILTPVWDLFYDLTISKVIKTMLEKSILRKAHKPNVAVPDAAKDVYKCKFAYSVVADGECILTSQQSKWKGVKTMANPPKGMLFFDKEGDQAFFAGRNHYAEAGENFTVYADKTATTGEHVLNQAEEENRTLGKQIEQVAGDLIWLQSGQNWNTAQALHFNKFLGGGRYSGKKGIKLVTYSDHDIEIKQQDEGVQKGTGKITLKSNERVDIQADKAEIQMGKIDGTPGISILFGDDTEVTLYGPGIHIIRKGKQVRLDDSGVSIYSGSGAPILTIQGSKVTVKGDLTVTGKFTQPDQVND